MAITIDREASTDKNYFCQIRVCGLTLKNIKKIRERFSGCCQIKEKNRQYFHEVLIKVPTDDVYAMLCREIKIME